MAAANIDSTSRLRSVSSGVRPSPITITRYTATTTAVRPVADTVCTRTRSTRREIRALVPAASASGTRPVAAAATAAAWLGQSTSRFSAATTSATSRITATAQPTSCRRCRARPEDRWYVWCAAGRPMRMANVVAAATAGTAGWRSPMTMTIAMRAATR